MISFSPFVKSTVSSLLALQVLKTILGSIVTYSVGVCSGHSASLGGSRSGGLYVIYTPMAAGPMLCKSHRDRHRVM